MKKATILCIILCSHAINTIQLINQTSIPVLIKQPHQQATTILPNQRQSIPLDQISETIIMPQAGPFAQDNYQTLAYKTQFHNHLNPTIPFLKLSLPFSNSLAISTLLPGGRTHMHDQTYSIIFTDLSDDQIFVITNQQNHQTKLLKAFMKKSKLREQKIHNKTSLTLRIIIIHQSTMQTHTLAPAQQLIFDLDQLTSDTWILCRSLDNLALFMMLYKPNQQQLLVNSLQRTVPKVVNKHLSNTNQYQLDPTKGNLIFTEQDSLTPQINYLLSLSPAP